MCITNFAIINIIGLDPLEVRVKDITMGMFHNGFETWAQV